MHEKLSKWRPEVAVVLARQTSDIGRIFEQLAEKGFGNIIVLSTVEQGSSYAARVGFPVDQAKLHLAITTDGDVEYWSAFRKQYLNGLGVDVIRG